MEGSQKDTPNSQSVPTNIQEGANIYEDEINLIDYFRVLWNRKCFIVLASVLPALVVGLIIFLWPRDYKVTYVYDVRGRSIYDVRDQSIYDVRDQSIYDVRDQSIYDVSNWNLNENNYKILLDRFYSAENTGKIATKLQENGLNKYAKRINTGGLKNLVDFEVSPPYIKHSKSKTINSAELERLRQLEAQLLHMTIIGRPKNNISKISSVIRDNLENVIPMYMIQNQLSSALRAYRGKMASIEENKFNQELALKTNKAVLAKLKNIKTKVSDESESNIALQFDISGKTEYLPLRYQIQAAESKTVQLEEQIASNEETYNHYKDLLALSEKLFAKLKKKTSSYYTIQQFRLFLIVLIDSYENKQLKNYLNSYIKKIENRISASAPVMHNPKVYVIAKGTVKKSAIVFAIALMISVFTAFLLEGIQRSQGKMS